MESFVSTRLLPFLLLLSLFTACTPDRHFPIPPPQSDIPTYNLKGPVQAVTQTDSTFTDSTSPPRIVIRSYAFNDHGQLTSAVHEVPGEVRNERTYAYDSLHRKVEYRNTSSKNDASERTISIYASHGLLAERQTFNAAGELMEKGSYEYTDEGKIALQIQYIYTRRQGGERKTTGIEVNYGYDGEGQLASKNTFRRSNPLQVEIYSEGQLVETRRFNGQTGDPTFTIRHSRSSNTQIDSTFLPDGQLQSVSTEEENSDGKQLSATVKDLKQGTFSEVISTYNENGDLETREEKYRSDADQGLDLDFGKWRYVYEYDARGNWTRRTQRRNGGIEAVSIREITYR